MSFYYAFEGFFTAIRYEKNLRFHLVIANLIAVFAYFYGISRMEWALLILCIGAVISAELFNTALERAVDTATSDILPKAKLAKDAAAAAVLIFAIAAVLVGVCLFGDVQRIGETLVHIFTAPKILVPCLILGTADLLFLIFGGKHEK